MHVKKPVLGDRLFLSLSAPGEARRTTSKPPDDFQHVVPSFTRGGTTFLRKYNFFEELRFPY
ncbi:hypothetical protein DESPIG_00270 [Desulfovibrio piger ATCC 29098]|uniref:Uncharacterized protein n=1 Tax=Desulfovibrio piger ATCC 29098 TaxID=411464 RepID=B6WQF0_9BACT|nr:hypothetical protein DESPIG_00270 [Desulfovibrio piger ATCC 29098]